MEVEGGITMEGKMRRESAIIGVTELALVTLKSLFFNELTLCL